MAKKTKGKSTSRHCFLFDLPFLTISPNLPGILSPGRSESSQESGLAQLKGRNELASVISTIEELDTQSTRPGGLSTVELNRVRQTLNEVDALDIAEDDRRRLRRKIRSFLR